MPTQKTSKRNGMENPMNDSPKNVINYVMVGILVIAAFVIGSLYQKVKYLEGGGIAVKGTLQQTGQPTTAQQEVQAEPEVDIEKVREAYNKSVIKFGDAKSKLIFIEVADPSCPYCHIAAGKNNELNKQAGERFTLVEDGGTYVAPVVEMKKMMDKKQAAFAWLYTNGHGNGEMGSKALYCAYEAGKFWQVHDKLMSNEGYKLLNENVRNDKAKSSEMAQFLSSVFPAKEMKECLDSGKYDSRLQEDSTIASGLGVSGTPGFFVNNTKFAGAYSYKDMESSVDEALK